MTTYITGDIHGHPDDMIQNLQKKKIKTGDTVIILGDAGLEYGDSIMGSAKKKLAKLFDINFFIIRGNHDTRYWRDHTSYYSLQDSIVPKTGWAFSDIYDEITLYQEKYPNIHYANDSGGYYTFSECNCLCIPGAYSVDQEYRILNGLPYEKEEQLNSFEWNKLSSLARVNKDITDFVLAHTYPLALENRLVSLFMDGIDQSQVSKFTEKWIDTIMNNIESGARFKHYFFGHMHADRKAGKKYTLLYKKIVKMEDYIK